MADEKTPVDMLKAEISEFEIQDLNASNINDDIKEDFRRRLYTIFGELTDNIDHELLKNYDAEFTIIVKDLEKAEAEAKAKTEADAEAKAKAEDEDEPEAKAKTKTEDKVITTSLPRVNTEMPVVNPNPTVNTIAPALPNQFNRTFLSRLSGTVAYKGGPGEINGTRYTVTLVADENNTVYVESVEKGVLKKQPYTLAELNDGGNASTPEKGFIMVRGTPNRKTMKNIMSKVNLLATAAEEAAGGQTNKKELVGGRRMIRKTGKRNRTKK